VGVDVDEPGRHHVAGGVDLPAAGAVDPPHRGDALAVHGDVGRPGRGPGPVDQAAVADDQIVHAVPLVAPAVPATISQHQS
jgi:hypothetical protein